MVWSLLSCVRLTRGPPGPSLPACFSTGSCRPIQHCRAQYLAQSTWSHFLPLSSSVANSEVKRQIIGQWNWVLCGAKLKMKFLQHELRSEMKTQQTKPCMSSKWSQREACKQPGSVWTWQGHWAESSEAVLLMQCCYQVMVQFKNAICYFPHLLTRYPTHATKSHMKSDLSTKFFISFCQCKFSLSFTEKNLAKHFLNSLRNDQMYCLNYQINSWPSVYLLLLGYITNNT